MKKIKIVIISLIYMVGILLFINTSNVFAESNNSEILIQNNELTFKRKNDGETFISGFKIGEKVSEILERKFIDGYTIKIKNNEGTDITNSPDTTIGTGDKIELYLPDEEFPKKTYTVVIYGDTNGNSNIEAADALAIIKNKIGTEKFKNNALEEAGRIKNETRENSTTPNSVDALYLIKYKLYPEKYLIDQKLNKPDKEILTLTVNHYLENANDENYTLSTTTTQTVLYNTEITLENLKTTIENGTYKHASLSENGTEQIKCTIKTDTTIHLYYSRNTYTVTLQAGKNITNVSGGGNCKIGASIPINATFIEGYDSVEWKIVDGYGIIGDWKLANTTVTPERNMTLEANAQEAFVQVGNHFYPNIMMAKSMEDLSGENKTITMNLLKSRKVCTTEDNVKGIYFWENNVEYILDLGGNTLTLDENYKIYIDKGRVEIKNGTIILKDKARIHNNSTLILDSVDILSTSSEEVVLNYGNLTLNETNINWNPSETNAAFGAIINFGNFTMNSGTITASGLYNYCLDNRNGGKSYIYDGILDGKNLNMATITNNSEGIITIGTNETTPIIYGPTTYDSAGNTNPPIINKGTITMVSGNIYGLNNNNEYGIINEI